MRMLASTHLIDGQPFVHELEQCGIVVVVDSRQEPHFEGRKVNEVGAGSLHAGQQVSERVLYNRPHRLAGNGGMGLGLSVARSVIRGHGGDIVLGDRDGGGLRVRVTLPVLG